MDPFGQESARVALIKIAREVAGDPAVGAEFLKHFRAAYLHLAATVDSATTRADAAMAEGIPGWANGPMPVEMMSRDPEKMRKSAAELLAATESLSDFG